MKKISGLLISGALLFAACNDESAPRFGDGRYMLVSLGGQQLPAGLNHFVTLAETLVVHLSEKRVTQTLHYIAPEGQRSAVTEFPMEITDGKMEIDFHCISGQGCALYYAPEFGGFRGDTLQFVHRDSITRTYVRR